MLFFTFMMKFFLKINHSILQKSGINVCIISIGFVFFFFFPHRIQEKKGRL